MQCGGSKREVSLLTSAAARTATSVELEGTDFEDEGAVGATEQGTGDASGAGFIFQFRNEIAEGFGFLWGRGLSLFGGDVLLDLAGEGRELQNGIGAVDFEDEVCALRFELAVNFSFETTQARADANVENVIGKSKGIDEPPTLQAQFAGGGFEIRTLADECDAIQAPKALADRHPSFAQSAGTIHIDAQRVGANGRLGD